MKKKNKIIISSIAILGLIGTFGNDTANNKETLKNDDNYVNKSNTSIVKNSEEKTDNNNNVEDNNILNNDDDSANNSSENLISDDNTTCNMSILFLQSAKKILHIVKHNDILFLERRYRMGNYFAKNIKYLRTKKNIDQQVMAEDLGIAQSTLSCWENGLRSPDLDMISKIAKYLNVYDDFISKDLTSVENNNQFDETNILYDKYKDILTDSDKNIIKTIIEERKRQIDEQLGDDS